MSEWEVDEQGKRYRMVGKIKEYEPIICTSFGNIPESQLEEATRSVRAAEKAERERELKRQMDDAARCSGKVCPLRKCNNCRPDCALLGDSGCTYICPSTSPGKYCPHAGVGACTASCGAFRGCTSE